MEAKGQTQYSVLSTQYSLDADLAAFVEQGMAHYHVPDVPVRTYLPDLKLSDPDATERATMTHLLTHTGGWVGDYFNDLGAGDDALAKMAVQMAEVPQLAPLGTLWSYNNAA